MSHSKVIDGKKLSQKILKGLADKISKLPTQPGLAAVLVGDDAASHTYVNLKEKAAKQIGIHFENYLLPQTVNRQKITQLIKRLNSSRKIHAILVQLPLPKKFETQKVIDCIDVQKDVDGFKKDSWVPPPTITGIIELIKSTKIEPKNKRAYILANSQTFAKPLRKLLENFGLKVEVGLFNKTKKQFNNLTIEQFNNRTAQADIIVIAIGQAEFFTADDIKKGSIVIDVGINRVGKKIVGDVDFASVFKKAAFITPAPGGVGPMTVACLMKNVYKLYTLANPS